VCFWLFLFSTKARVFLDQGYFLQKGLHENPLKKIAIKARPAGFCLTILNLYTKKRGCLNEQPLYLFLTKIKYQS
jgi:hypothetical protein